MLGDDAAEMVINPVGAHISQAKHDYARHVGSAGRNKLAEVEIMREQNAALISRFPQNGWIRQAVKTLIVQVESIMAQTL